MYASCRATLSEKILDEISLEGLEGVTLSTLWLHLGEALSLKDMPEKFKIQIWQFIQRNTSQLQFYELPTNRPTLPLYKRFEVLDPDYGVPVSKTDSPQRRYKFVPIQDNGIVGSCECYKERTEIPADCIKEASLNDINEKYGERFVIVASQELRYNALFPSSVLISKDVNAHLYCMLEIIGRSRHNGETTSGSSSLQDYCKDATIVFYVKQQLHKMGVVATQNYNELRKGRLMLTTLLRLPRFYTAHQSALDFVIETTFNALKESPNHSLPLVELRALFPAEEKFTSLKKIVQTHQFRRIFNVNSVPFPSTSTKSKPSSSSEESKGRIRVVVSLREPNMASEDLFKEKGKNEEAAEPAEDDNSSFNKLAYVDMLLKDQLYNAIFRHGVRGLSQSEMGSFLGVPNLAIRQMVKNLMEKHLVSIYFKDAGRQRVKMYVAIEYAENISKYNASMQETKKLKCDDEPALPPPPTQQNLLEVPEIQSTVQPYKYIVNQTKELSNRQISRTAMIIKALNEKCLIHIFEIINLIATKEKELGLKDTACRKSIRRILNHLSENGTVNVFEVVLKLMNEKNIRIHRFVTHPKIHIDHDVVKKEILSLKTAFYLKIEEKRLQLESARQAAELKLEKKERSKMEKVAQKKKAEQKREVFQKIPKFLVSRFMHEFLYYIVVELSEYKTSEEITEEVVQNWKQTEPSLLTREYMELLKTEDAGVKAYSSEITWRTFIPPLPKYSDKPAGWVYLIDAIERMPLSIFMKIFRLENNLHESLENYVSHPIRQHYLINQLPVELNSLINRIYMQKVFLTVLKLLNNMGLVQVSDQMSKQDKLRMWIFFNRNALVMDTTTSEASYSRINPNRQYESIRYTFNTFEDVYRYWMNLQRICIYTKLGFRKNTERHKQRIKGLTFVELVDFDEAMLKDTGYLPGDGLGAAGLSTELFAHVFRNWSWAITSSSKLKQSTAIHNRRTQMSLGTKKVLRLKKAARGKKHPIPIALVKRMLPAEGGSKNATGGNPSTSIGKRSKTNFRDAIDREALKNMRTLRVTWTAEEDKLLKIARAVYVFLSPPVVSLQLVTVSKICRDLIRHTIGIRNKTIQACLRRYHFLIKKNRHLPETPLWLNMLQTNDQLMEKYNDDFILQLKQVYPDRNEYCNALTIHFIEVMCHLFKQIHNIEESVGPQFCIPDSITEFESSYITRTHAKNEEKLILHENPKSDYDLKVSVVYGLLHCSMCCVRDKTLFPLQAFEIFKHFSEDVLKSAYTKARSDGLAVVLKRRFMSSQSISSHLTGPSYLLSSKYRLKLIFLKIPYQTYEAIYNALLIILEELYSPKGSNKAAAAPSQCYELKSPHIGQLICISEGLAKDYWNLSLQFPTNILTVDSEQPIFSSDRILHHYHGILDNAPKIEYIKNFNSENVEKRVRVKFHSANLSYKIYYAPYDLISKLPTRYLHFFCALDHYQQSVDINFSKLNRREDDSVLECPFNCVMKNANYLDAIERIVHQKKNILHELQETTAQKVFNQVTGGNTIKIQSSNLLAVVRMLEKAWADREEQNDRKDLGKKLVGSKDKKVVDWIKICQSILEYNIEDDDVDKCDEYEPLLTKDDRIRDAFVINLPTIKVKPSDFLRADKKIEYNTWKVPQSLLPVETVREDILEKVKRDSIWMYTEETFKTLVPKLKELKFSSMERKHIEEIHDFIETKKFGVSFKELLDEFPYRKFLNRALDFLIDNFLVKRVGVAKHVYVHKTHLREWVVHTFHITRRDHENLKAQKRIHDQEKPHCSSKRPRRDRDQKEGQTETETEAAQETPPTTGSREDTLQLPKERDVIVLRPRPWIRLNGSLNRRVLDKWLGSILSECNARYGCYVVDLCEHFQNMFPADIHFLLEILSDIKCISLKEIHTEEIDLGSDYKDIEEIPVNEIIDPDCTYVVVSPDALSRMTNFIGDKKYNADFI